MREGDKYSVKFSATAETYTSFIQTFKDKNPLHTDIDFAKAKGFDSVVLHGNILNGFISYFVGECLPDKNVMILSQQIDFHNPFFVGDELTLSVHLKEVSQAFNTMEFKFVFRNQTNKKIAKGKIFVKQI